HALLRELTLAAAAGADTGVDPEDLAAAYDAYHAIGAGVSAALDGQPSASHVHALSVSLPAGVARAVRILGRVLDAAEQAARDERLLTWPSLPQNRVFRRWLLDQITGQLTGGPPTAWTMVPREPSASPSELVAWDASQVWASRVPTIAADDDNRIIVANGPAADMLGWQEDELVGQRLTVLIPEHLRDRHTAAFTRLLLTGQPHILGRSVPLPALHRDGRQVPVRLFIQTQVTADGRTVYVAQLAPRTAPPVPAPLASGESQAVSPQPPGGPELPDDPERVTETDSDEPDGPARERRLLADIGESLSSTPNLDEGLQRVCKILTQPLADWCVVDL
ncbi:PAS domain-containing protein, partial [Streptomyces chrestomyceticus]|uniref:PAS domain-containing protein n=1 Tax=Streptomyces chrestomyceticus TaxID=68185 RepID=UPI0033C277F3